MNETYHKDALVEWKCCIWTNLQSNINII